MRYAIFSDVHANRQAWDAVREDARRQGADTLICLGDVVGYGPKPLEVLTSVRESTPNFVLGNHDAAACGRLDASIFNPQARTVIAWTRERLNQEALEFLNQVPLQMNGEGIQFVHAEVSAPGEFGYVNGPEPAGLCLRAMTQPLAFIGHTHLPLAYTMPRKGGRVTQLPPIDFQVARGQQTLVNVGSVGEPRTTDVRASYVIYDDVKRRVTFRKVAFDVDGYRRDLEETGLDIRPYFVEVVEAGMAAGKPSPVASPQLAMAQLPSVAVGVTGDHGQLVLGRGRRSLASVRPPRIMSGGVVAVLITLAVMTVGGLTFLVVRGGTGKAAPSEQTAEMAPDKEREADIKPRDPTPVPMEGKREPKATIPPLQSRPRPEPNTAPAGRLSQDLLSYWSFDGRHGTGNRFERQPDGSVREILVHEKDQKVQVLAPERDLGIRWRDPDFDATGWTHGLNGVGYEDKPAEYKSLIQTRAGGTTREHPHSILVRIPFKIDDPAAYAGLALYMKFDDGFAAFLNGRPMASKNAPTPLRWNSASTAQNDDTKAVVPELFKVNPSLADLKKGWNILAIHGLNGSGQPNQTNTGSTSSDMLILPTLVALRKDNTLPKSVEEGMRNTRDQPVTPDQIDGKVELTGGLFGDAYEFTDGSLEIGEKDKYSIGDQSFSVSLWLSRERNSGDREVSRLISAGAGNIEQAGWSLAMNRAADTLRFEITDGLDRSTISAKVDNLADGQWRHVVVTVDHPSESVRIYLDGEPVAARHVDFLGRSTITSTSGLSIGRKSDDKQHHHGKLDEIAIWRRTLAPAEVERIFNAEQRLRSIFDAEATE